MHGDGFLRANAGLATAVLGGPTFPITECNKGNKGNKGINLAWEMLKWENESKIKAPSPLIIDSTHLDCLLYYLYYLYYIQLWEMWARQGRP